MCSEYVTDIEKNFLEDVEAEGEPTFSDMFVRATADLNDHLTLLEYVDVNKNLHIASMSTDTEILSTVKAVTNLCEESDDDDDIDEGEEELSVPYTAEVRRMIKSVRCYLDTHTNGDFPKI